MLIEVLYSCLVLTSVKKWNDGESVTYANYTPLLINLLAMVPDCVQQIEGMEGMEEVVLRDEIQVLTVILECLEASTISDKQ